MPANTDLFLTLQARFKDNPQRHPKLEWKAVLTRLKAAPKALRALAEMERTGGEPDVVVFDRTSGGIVFVDCAPESPAGRRSVCFDRDGWLSRKEARPANTAMDLAAEIGVTLLTEDEYFALQRVGEFDRKTSSWIATPPEIRALGGALYAERRYDRVFVGHNGAQSYYAARGFRGAVRL